MVYLHFSGNNLNGVMEMLCYLAYECVIKSLRKYPYTKPLQRTSGMSGDAWKMTWSSTREEACLTD